jgi:ubiquinone/menaquinone biosynthesis C-methylase UbiE
MTNTDLLAETPDIETSSADYASRFSGRAGEFFLDVQAQTVSEALAGLTPGTVLDVGGGHGQLVDPLTRLGWRVTVHGTSAECERNLRELHGKRDCAFLQGRLFDLPVADRSFDAVVAVRLFAHVPDWPRLVAEMCRVARYAIVIDYPSKSGLNALTPLLFGVKKSYERNTRSYLSFTRDELATEFARHGFGVERIVKQFCLPMVAHRATHGSASLRWVERACRASGLTARIGSPVILRLDRRDGGAGS